MSKPDTVIMAMPSWPIRVSALRALSNNWSGGAPGVTFSPFMASESQRKGGKKQSLPALE